MASLILRIPFVFRFLFSRLSLECIREHCKNLVQGITGLLYNNTDTLFHVSRIQFRIGKVRRFNSL